MYFLHNRVESIDELKALVLELVPKARVAIAHGQMPEGKLEEVMTDFVEKKFDVLVCTTIIESGLDIPSANTMLVNRADMFGLAQLYQIRGRVGRSRERAYCWPARDEGPHPVRPLVQIDVLPGPSRVVPATMRPARRLSSHENLLRNAKQVLSM